MNPIVMSILLLIVSLVGALAYAQKLVWRAKQDAKELAIKLNLAERRALALEDELGDKDFMYYRQLADSRLEIVYRYQEQRDDWKDRFMKQSVEHGNAVELVGKRLQRERQVVVRLAALVNKMRVEQKLEPLTQVAEIEDKTKPLDPPVQLARQYIDDVKKLFDEAQKDIDTRRELRAADMAAAKAASAEFAAKLLDEAHSEEESHDP